MKSQIDKFVGRNIFEVRLKNKNLEFVDFKGEMAQFLMKNDDFQNFKMFANRIDLTNENNSRIFFISWENLGLQIESIDNNNDLSNEKEKLFKLISSYSKFEIENISRIGIKTTKIIHFRNKTLEQLKQAFTKIFFRDQKIFEQSGVRITDNGIFALEVDYKTYKAHINMGVMTKKEVIEKVFQNNLYDNFSYEYGIFIDIDIYTDIYQFDDFSTLSTDSEQQIKSLFEIENVLLSSIKGELNE